MYYRSTPEGKDPQLWQLAQKRAGFRSHLTTYLIVNVGLWVIWFFTGEGSHYSGFPWPAWASLGWGIGLASHYVSAYVNTGENTVEKEYEKLTQKQSK